MADEPPLAGLLDQAGKAFSLIRKLGWEFSQERQGGGVVTPDWNRHRQDFDALLKILRELRQPMLHPPAGFCAVAQQLQKAWDTAEAIHRAVQGGHEEHLNGDPFLDYAQFFPDLNSIAIDGTTAVVNAVKGLHLTNYIGLSGDATGGDAENQPLTLLDRFQATPAGHIGFLEFVRDDIHQAAEAKRHQFARSYSNDTLKSMLDGRDRLCTEARKRIATLNDLPCDIIRAVDVVLRRDLTIGTVERFDELLQPAVQSLRDAFENSRSALVNVKASQTEQAAASFDTTPSPGMPRPPDALVDTAMRDIPAALIENVISKQRGDTPYPTEWLVIDLMERGHLEPAARWAIHIMAERGEFRVNEKGGIDLASAGPLWEWWSGISAATGADAIPARQQSAFHAARERAQRAAKQDRGYEVAKQQEKKRRLPLLEAWMQIYKTRPRPELGTSRSAFAPDDWRPFAEAIIAFCDLARVAGFEQMLRAVKCEDDRETIAHGLVIEGFKSNAAGLADMLAGTPVTSGWLIWFNNELSGRWLPWSIPLPTIPRSSESATFETGATLGDLADAIQAGALDEELNQRFGDSWLYVHAAICDKRVASNPKSQFSEVLRPRLLEVYRPGGRRPSWAEARKLLLVDVVDLLAKPVQFPISRPQPDVVIVTVNEHETRAVHDEFRAATGSAAVTVSLDGRLYRDLGILNGATVFHALSEMGPGGIGAMQQTVDKAISALKPGAVIAVGIAFGMDDEKQEIGDVLVSKQLRPYDLQRVGGGITLRDDKPHASARLINHFDGFAQTAWHGRKIRSGVILTGSKLVDDVDYREQLLSFEREAVGGEMEGAGLYVSCQEHKVDWIVIKAICDWADGKKSIDKTARQMTAAKNAAQFLVQAMQYAPLKRHG